MVQGSPSQAVRPSLPLCLATTLSMCSRASTTPTRSVTHSLYVVCVYYVLTCVSVCVCVWQDSYYSKLLAIGLIIALTSLNCYGVKETSTVVTHSLTHTLTHRQTNALVLSARAFHPHSVSCPLTHSLTRSLTATGDQCAHGGETLVNCYCVYCGSSVRVQ